MNEFLMTEPTVENRVCEKCRAEIRPDTQFCYNCGTHIDEMSSESEPAATLVESEENESLADLEKALAASRVESSDGRAKLEAAARERRLARNARRKPIEIVWEPVGQLVGLTYFVAVGVIFVLVLLLVLLTVFWK